MSLTIHQSGIDAAISAQAEGFSGVTLNRADLYNGSTKIKSVTLAGVQVIEPGRIYVVAQDSSTDSYDVTKILFYTSGNELFATAQNSDHSIIQSKAANSTLLLAHQLVLSSAPGTVAPSGDVTVFAPQATESLLGTAEIATQNEVDAGTDDTRFVTPKKLATRLLNLFTWNNLPNKPSTATRWPSWSEVTGKPNASTSSYGQTKLSTSTSSTSTTLAATPSAVKSAKDQGTRQATESLRGQVEIATQTEANGSSDDTRAITAKKLYNRTATTSRRGVAEVATQSEVNAGTDTSRMVVPAYLKGWWDGVKTVFKSAAFKDAGQNEGQVALIGDPSVNGNTAVVIEHGVNANGCYEILSNGVIRMWGNTHLASGQEQTLPIPSNLNLEGDSRASVRLQMWSSVLYPYVLDSSSNSYNSFKVVHGHSGGSLRFQWEVITR